MKVQANFSAPVDIKTRIMYIPEGSHGITPTVDGKPGSIVSNVSAERGEAIVEALNKALKKRHAKNVRPIIDFDHKDSGPAAALPTEFSYVEGKGIMMDVEWTATGTASIEGKDYSYFSPVYNMDRNTGEPIGLPSSGPIGALVNDPAFREIEKIAAANSHNQIPEMDINVLIKAGLVTEAESKTDKVAEIAAANIQTIQAQANKVPDLEAEVVTLKASLKAGSEATADQLVKAAQDSGRIAAKDESTTKYWRDQLIEAANDPDKLKTVSAALNAIPEGDDITKQIVNVKGGQAKSGDMDARYDEAMIKAAKSLPNAGHAELFEKARDIDPEAFKD
jgi:phage I-like protein